MMRFKQFLLEALVFEHQFMLEATDPNMQHKESSRNAALFERLTVLHIHNKTAAKANTSKHYDSHITKVKTEVAHLERTIHPKKVKELNHLAENASDAYLHSMKKNHRVSPHQIHEVYHTPHGISHVTGNPKHDRMSNPHDFVVKVKKHDGKESWHGGSLKMKKGTLTNMSVSSMDKVAKKHGISLSLSSVWEKGARQAGVHGSSQSKVKERRHEPEVRAAYRETTHEAAKHHAQKFNAASTKQQKSYLNQVFRASPDVPYHHVVANRSKSTPAEKLTSSQRIKHGTSFHAEARGNKVRFTDHNGEVIGHIEHRSTHGPFSSNQANAKI